MIFLVVKTFKDKDPDDHRVWHRCVLIDDAQSSNVGNVDFFVEKSHDLWEDDNDEPLWERVV
jgi:hypothetical protein